MADSRNHEKSRSLKNGGNSCLRSAINPIVDCPFWKEHDDYMTIRFAGQSALSGWEKLHGKAWLHPRPHDRWGKLDETSW